LGGHRVAPKKPIPLKISSNVVLAAQFFFKMYTLVEEEVLVPNFMKNIQQSQSYG
jgi:hypothetical protein